MGAGYLQIVQERSGVAHSCLSTLANNYDIVYQELGARQETCARTKTVTAQEVRVSRKQDQECNRTYHKKPLNYGTLGERAPQRDPHILTLYSDVGERAPHVPIDPLRNKREGSRRGMLCTRCTLGMQPACVVCCRT